jgi:transposase
MSVSSVLCPLREEEGPKKQVRRFSTMTGDLLELSQWLQELGVTRVALESTGVYWKPVWNLLEGQFEPLLVKCSARQRSAWAKDALLDALLEFIDLRPL